MRGRGGQPGHPLLKYQQEAEGRGRRGQPAIPFPHPLHKWRAFAPYFHALLHPHLRGLHPPPMPPCLLQVDVTPTLWVPYANPTNNPFLYTDAPTHPFLISQGINETTDYRVIMVGGREGGQEAGMGAGQGAGRGMAERGGRQDANNAICTACDSATCISPSTRSSARSSAAHYPPTALPPPPQVLAPLPRHANPQGYTAWSSAPTMMFILLCNPMHYYLVHEMGHLFGLPHATMYK